LPDKLLNKIGEGDREFTPNKELLSAVENGSYSLNENPLYNNNKILLFNSTLKTAYNLFANRTNYNSNNIFLRTISLMGEIAQIESPHKNTLEKLAVDIVSEIYDVPNTIELKVSLNPQLSLDTNQNHKNNLDQTQNLKEHIIKREILSGLVHGSSIHFWKSAFHLASAQLNRLDPRLLPLYNELTSTVNISFFKNNPQSVKLMINNNSKITQGYNKIDFESSVLTINCFGINFPTLLHEINKGIMDYLISHGIPSYLSSQEQEYIIETADDYQKEFYHYILSPPIWTELLNCASIENNQIPSLIMNISLLDLESLLSLMQNTLNNQTKAKEMINNFKID
jgi:hypothetical protein